MTDNVLITIITAASAVSVGIAGLGINAVWMGKAFSQMNRSMDGLKDSIGDIRNSLDEFKTSTNRRLDVIESDLKEYFRLDKERSIDIARMKDKMGLN